MANVQCILSRLFCDPTDRFALQAASSKLLLKSAIKLSVVVWAALMPLTAAAQTSQPYPSKPVRLIIGPASGGPTDITARTFAAKMTEVWGQQVVVENHPGAGNTLAPPIAAKASPDGYTLLLCPISDAVAPALYKNLSYNLLTSFAPISLVGTTPNVLFVNQSVPARSVSEFVAYSKANAGKISYGSAGVGISTHLSVELFKSMTGADITHVPYKGSVAAFTDLIGGRIEMQADNLPGVVDAIKANRVRALGVTTLKRNAQVPDVPTIAESGVPGYEVTVWYGICAPAGTPKPIVTKINADMAKALNMPDLRQRLYAQGVDATPNSPEAFTAFIKAETTKWAKVVKDAGIPSQ
jgi:tripartite-type tricarboxylate transporter receptor subunit TctC